MSYARKSGKISLELSNSGGLSLRHIQGLLGHSTPTTTALYAHLTEETGQQASETINRLVDRLHIDLKRL